MTWLAILATAVLALVVCSTLIQGMVVARFVRIVRCFRDEPGTPVRLPATTVVLPLRGADPWLPALAFRQFTRLHAAIPSTPGVARRRQR
jgi:hypothetical protein